MRKHTLHAADFSSTKALGSVKMEKQIGSTKKPATSPAVEAVHKRKEEDTIEYISAMIMRRGIRNNYQVVLRVAEILSAKSCKTLLQRWYWRKLKPELYKVLYAETDDQLEAEPSHSNYEEECK